MTEPAIRNISDTARWAAMYRALETERPNPLFRDPFARKLAGERGQQKLVHSHAISRHSNAGSSTSPHPVSFVCSGNRSDKLEAAQAPVKFAPPEGPPFFEQLGWRVLAVESTLKDAARVKRVGLFFRLIAKLPDSKGAQSNRPWSATCLLGK